MRYSACMTNSTSHRGEGAPGSAHRAAGDEVADPSGTRWQRAAIHLGGFVGPFVGQSISVVLPEFSRSFGISVSLAALTITAYTFPFAVAMLFSGRLVRGFSPSKVVLVAFAVICAGAVGLMLAPTWWTFLTIFVIMAIANAFTTPVLQGILKRITPDHELGTALGTFTAMQSLGVFSAPLLAGAAALISWRLTYLVVIASVVFIFLVRVPMLTPAPRRVAGDNERVRWGYMSVHMLTFLILGAGVVGMPFAVSLLAAERFDLGSAGRGAVVMCGGLAAFIFSRFIGRAVDALGVSRSLALGLGSVIAGLLCVPLSPHPIVIAVAWALALVGMQAVQIIINMLVLRSPGGTELLSTVLAFRFFGAALAPVVMMPVFTASHYAAFWIPAAGAVIALGLQLAVARRAAARRAS